ncbi:MAG TPA: FecR domain-containing protein [Steroidobacteraceae bacterium]|jgi:transmembrane sensor
MSLTPRSPKAPPPVSDEIAAAAASWVAQVHDAGRGPELDGRLRAWLQVSEEHRRAFRRMESAWERAGQIRLRAPREGTATRLSARFGWRRAALTAGAAAAVVAAVVLVQRWRDDSTVTRVGQQQTRVLPDGTRVLLNTDTRIEVSYDEHARRLRLVHGEAWFDVSHHPSWPFLVSVDGEEIRALGTSFIVRHDDAQDLSVTLVEGRIVVAPIAAGADTPLPNPQVMVPGQRLTLSEHHAPAIDRPELGRITAWKHGQVDFDQTPLRDAAEEMNRYSGTHVLVTDAEVARLRVGGVFRAGDSEEFVRVVTAAFGLRAERRGEDIVLSPAEAPPH